MMAIWFGGGSATPILAHEDGQTISKGHGGDSATGFRGGSATPKPALEVVQPLLHFYFLKKP
jgi:hypothetical protein